jgi:hypothetical protein
VQLDRADPIPRAGEAIGDVSGPLELLEAEQLAVELARGGRVAHDDRDVVAGVRPGSSRANDDSLRSRMRRDLAIAAALVAATLAIYAQTLGFGFISLPAPPTLPPGLPAPCNFDDDKYVTRNPWVQAGLGATA